jgi:hypothetical protein
MLDLLRLVNSHNAAARRLLDLDDVKSAESFARLSHLLGFRPPRGTIYALSNALGWVSLPSPPPNSSYSGVAESLPIVAHSKNYLHF